MLAPKRVAETVWHVERDTWRPDLTLARAIGTPRQRQRARDESADITVMSRDTIGDISSGEHPYKTIVLDEMSGYKNKSTARWRETRKVVRRAERCWGLTGTPTPNGYLDLFSQIFLLDMGVRLGTTLGGYRERYFTPGRILPTTNVVTEWLLKPGSEDAINALIEDICLSMRADEYLALSPLTFNLVSVPLPPKVRRVVSDLRDTLVADLDMLGFAPGTTHTAANAAALSNRLRQASAGFLYDDASEASRWSVLHSEKVDALTDIVAETGDNVLVFYQFGAERDAIMTAFKGVARVISEPGVIEEWNAGRVRVLLAHPASAGHGLNLQHGGHTIVWTSLPWSLEQWQQANKRLHRQNQKHPVVVHVLSSPGTADREVYRVLANKEQVQDALLRYLGEDERMLR